MNDIIVGVDKSATARTAAERAATIAAAFGANLHLVTSSKPGASHDVVVGGDHFHSDWVTDAETFLTGLRLALPHDQITSTVGLGDPATNLCDEAERLQARMIVVGNRRVQGASRVLGSVAGDVLKRAGCDVLIVNTTHS